VTVNQLLIAGGTLASLRSRLGWLDAGCTNSIADWIRAICSEILFMQPTGLAMLRVMNKPMAEHGHAH